ncbi:DNA-binding domain-containing protein, AraC-type [Polaromonas sp. CF318]|uniref:helix-turn-helix domain-containing protein n=1 Tax=Polaromonas sp. CF318 TaxID=1144318 RepID=UPI0002713D94|nr:AraC family transcriptional regulator [Polaromonas sp. CF318]EJL77544.1 DNA-binding domain-containing protein, AraC-type [Polaromonas sp. CF318]
MPAPPPHQCRVLATPWDGVYGTHIDSARHYRRHSHAVFGVGWLQQGAQTSASGRGQVEAYAGDILMCNPGEVHDGQPLGGPSRRWRMLYLEPAAMAAAMGAPDAAALELTRPVAQDARLRLALEQLLLRLQQWSGGGRAAGADALACEESLARVCELLTRRHTLAAERPAESATAINPHIHQVRECIAADLLAPPTLAGMARMAGLSRFQLLRHFEKAFGLTPHAWLLQQRAERARSLIRGGAGLAQAAAACGFADQSHMTRLFTRQFGFTPGAWQRATARTAGLQ